VVVIGATGLQDFREAATKIAGAPGREWGRQDGRLPLGGQVLHPAERHDGDDEQHQRQPEVADIADAPGPDQIAERERQRDRDVVPQVDGDRAGVEQGDRAVQRPDPAEWGKLKRHANRSGGGCGKKGKCTC